MNRQSEQSHPVGYRRNVRRHQRLVVVSGFKVTRESAPFNHQLYVTRDRDGSVWNLRHRTLTRWHSAGREQTELSENDTRGWLAEAGFSDRIVEAALAGER